MMDTTQVEEVDIIRDTIKATRHNKATLHKAITSSITDTDRIKVTPPHRQTTKAGMGSNRRLRAMAVIHHRYGLLSNKFPEHR